jgi:hypothetical protein
VLEGSPSLFQVNAVITKQVIDRYSVDGLAGILRALKKCGPFVVTSSFLKAADQAPSADSGWPCAIFSTLPDELSSSEIEKAIDFYLKRSSRETRVLWALWLKWRPLFDLTHPVKVCFGDERLPRSHIAILVASSQDSKLWPWICNFPHIANLVLQNACDSLKEGRGFTWSSIRPALHYCSESIMNQFWQAFLEYSQFEDADIPDCVRLLLVFAHRNPGHRKLGSMITWLLGVLSEEPRGRRQFLIIDCYNYLVTKFYKKPNYERDPISPRVNELINALDEDVKTALVTCRIPDENPDAPTEPPLFVSESAAARPVASGPEVRPAKWRPEIQDTGDGGGLFDELSPNWFL